MEESEENGSVGAGVPGPPPAPPRPPIAVTGVAGAARGRGRSSTAFFIALAVLVVGACALAGYLAITLVLVPFVRGSALEARLTERASAEYPGTTFVGSHTLVAPGTADAPGPTRDVYITLAYPRIAGFRFTAMYSAPAVVTTDAAAFENLDDFFQAQASPSQPAASFASMWMRKHPEDTCEYVIETGDSLEATRTYEVSSLPAAGGASTQEPRTTYFTYVTATDSWAETASDPAHGASGGAAAPVDGASVTDTATAVATALPGFTVAGAAQEPSGPWVAIISNTRFPKVRMAVSAEYLDASDTSDGMVTMFGAVSKRSDAFARMWTARHPGTIIESIEFDPDFTGAADLAQVGYSPGSAEGVGVAVTYGRFRYRASSDTWASVN